MVDLTVPIFTGPQSPGQTVGLKIQLASDSSGAYVPVIALDADLDIDIGTVNQGTGGSSAWKVDPSGVTSPVSLVQSLPAGTNEIGGVFAAPTSSSSFAITPGSSSALETSHVLKASPGNLYSLNVMTTAASGFLMTFNAVSVPADGTVAPVYCIPVPAGSAVSISFAGAPPDYYSTGIVAVFSTTGPFTKTSSVTAFFAWRVQ
jgi:hypothetical protein